MKVAHNQSGCYQRDDVLTTVKHALCVPFHFSGNIELPHHWSHLWVFRLWHNMDSILDLFHNMSIPAMKLIPVACLRCTLKCKVDFCTALALLKELCACIECELLKDIGKMCFSPFGGTLHHCWWSALDGASGPGSALVPGVHSRVCCTNRHKANLHLNNHFSRTLNC